MKLPILLVACIFIVQTCWSVPVEPSDDIPQESIDNAHDVWGDVFDALYPPTPDINRKSYNNFMNLAKELLFNSSVELAIDVALQTFNMEVQGSSCDKVNIDLKNILELNDIKDMESLNHLDKSIKPQKWKEIEDYLTEHLTTEQTQRAIIMLGPIRENATQQDKLNASKVSGESLLKYLKSDCKSDETEKTDEILKIQERSIV